MAFPTIPTAASANLLSTTTSAASTTHTFPNLQSLRSGAGPQAGDLLIAIIVQYQGGTAGNQFSSWGASFTEIADLSTVTALDQAIGVAYKQANGSETGTFTVTSANSFMSVNFLMRIPAGEWDPATAPEVSSIVRATGAVADAASFNPTNWDAEDTLWIAVYGHSETTTTGNPPDITAPPTNYTGQLIVARGADAVGNITGAVAFRQVNAAAEDAGVWTVTNANRGNGAALVIAVRPGAAPVIVPLDASSSAGSGTLDIFVPTVIPLDSSSSGGSGTLSIAAPTVIPLDSSSSGATGTLDIYAPSAGAPADLPLDPSSSSASGTLGLSAPSIVPLDPSNSSASGTLGLSAPSIVPLNSSSSSASGTLSLTAGVTESLYPSETLYPGESLFPGEEPVADLGVLESFGHAAGSLQLRTPIGLGSLVGTAQASGILGLTGPFLWVHKRLLVVVPETNLALQTIIPESSINLLMTVAEPLPLVVQTDERTTPVEVTEVISLQVVSENEPGLIIEVDE